MYSSEVSVSTVLAGAGAAVLLFVHVLVVSDQATAADATQPPHGMRAGLVPPLPEVKPRLEPGDEIAILDAVEIALTQAGDGATYVWRHDNGRVGGAIRMTGTFRDDTGRTCRNLEMMLTAGTYSRRRDGVACRQRDGVWELVG